MPDVISGVIIALVTIVTIGYYCLAMAKISKNPEPPKKFGIFFMIYAQKRLFWVCFIADLN